jgi:hypothetical protein
MEPAAGYLSPAYAAAVSSAGVPRPLPRSGGWIIERTVAVAGTGAAAPCDAMGSYPLFCCARWRELAADLDALDRPLVSLVVVTDPFGDYTAAELGASFPDRVARYKDHFVADLSRPLESFVSDHHRRYARAAARDVEVERCATPADFVDDWTALYGVLIRRHGITGIAAFSRAAFAAQLAVPGVALYRAVARDGGDTLGMTLWYRQGDVAYYHLGAYSERGYALRASFPLFWRAFEELAAQGVRWVDLGAGAALGGAGGQGTEGLVRFKRGWSTETRPTYLCGRIFRPAAYADLVRARGLHDVAYFPAYRHGEFT